MLTVVPMMLGCSKVGSYIIIDQTTSYMSITKTLNTELYFSTKKAHGTTRYSINVKEGQSLDLRTDIKVDEGNITVTLLSQSTKETIFDQKFEASQEFIIPLTEYAKYEIKVVHDDFKGSYDFKWSK